MKTAAIVLIACFATGCSSVRDNSTVRNSNASNIAIGSPTPSALENVPTPAVGSSNPEDEQVENAQFKGTAGITAKKNPNITAVAVLNEVRSARHGNYDRVVFEFMGKELPTYHIEYIDRPVRACGSGDVVPLAGDGWLEVRFSDARAHTPEGNPTIKDRSRSPHLPIVKDLKITCDFEAQVTWVMGVSSPNRYRVLELSNPTRLVIDIKHD